MSHSLSLSLQLELNGLTIDEKDTLTDSTEFLEEMWSVRETIDDTAATQDTSTLLQLQSTNTGRPTTL